MTLELTSLQAVVSKEDKDTLCLRSTRRDCSTMVGVVWGGGTKYKPCCHGERKVIYIKGVAGLTCSLGKPKSSFYGITVTHWALHPRPR